MDPARKAGAQAVIWTTGWRLLLLLLLGGGGSAARRGWRGYRRGPRKELSPTGRAVGTISQPEQRGLWERSSALVKGAVGEIPHFGQMKCGEDSCPGRLWDKFFHPEKVGAVGRSPCPGQKGQWEGISH